MYRPREAAVANQREKSETSEKSGQSEEPRQQPESVPPPGIEPGRPTGVGSDDRSTTPSGRLKTQRSPLVIGAVIAVAVIVLLLALA